MNVDIFTLCRQAQERDSQLFISGTFDTMETSDIPLVADPFYVAARVRFDPTDGDKHELSLIATDADGVL